MDLYFAPLEGITSNIFRRVHRDMFNEKIKYFAPFITPSDNERVSLKSLRDIMPEKNKGIDLVPQVLTNNSESFLKFAEKLAELGYSEININIGCPSQTVVKKNRGAGFLKNLDEMERFFDKIFSKCQIDVSVKTRTGFLNGEDFDKIVRIYSSFPLKSLIVHPRARADFYKGDIDINAFSLAYNEKNDNLIYNGDVFSKNDFANILRSFPKISGVMIGRGAIQNPAIFREINGGRRLAKAELLAFTDAITYEYRQAFGQEQYVVHKLKEIWLYMMKNYPYEDKILKKIKKASRTDNILMQIKNLPEIKE